MWWCWHPRQCWGVEVHLLVTSSFRTAFMDYCPDHFFGATRFLFLILRYFVHFCAVRKIRLAISSAFECTLIFRIVSHRIILLYSGNHANACNGSLLQFVLLISQSTKNDFERFVHYGSVPDFEGGMLIAFNF